MKNALLFIIPDYADSFMIIIWPFLIWVVASLIHRDISKGVVSTVIGLGMVSIFLAVNLVPPPYGMTIILVIPVIIQELYFSETVAKIPEAVKSVAKHVIILIVVLFLIYAALMSFWFLSWEEPRLSPNAGIGYEYNEETRQMFLRHECGETFDRDNTESLDVWVERNGSIIREVTLVNRTDGLPFRKGDKLIVEDVQINDTVSLVWESGWNEKTQTTARFSPDQQVSPCD